MRVDQLGLLLWKNYVVRKRQPGILALVFLWPVVIFMILYTLRDNVEPEYYPTCQFPARSMPQDGLLPFVQSFICGVGNPCDPLSEYEEVPSYKKAILEPLVEELQPMLGNETIISAVKTLPQSIQLLKSMAEILTRPEIKALFDRGIRLGDLFNNHEEIKSFLNQQMPRARKGLVNDLFDSSIKLYYLIDTFGSSNIDGVICTPESLKKYLLLSNDEDYAEVSRVLCDIDSQKIPDILENLSKHLDFSGLLGMVDRAMAKFRNYDFFQDLKRAVETILDLNTARKYIPQYLNIRDWLPQIILLFRNVTFKEIDLTFINRSIEVLAPALESEPNWYFARRGFLRINDLLSVVKDYVKNRTSDSPDDMFSIIENLRTDVDGLFQSVQNYDGVTQILDRLFPILQEGVRLTKKLLVQHADDFELTAEVFDGLRDFFSDNIMNGITYISSSINNIIQTAHHVAIIHEEVPTRLYKTLKKHQDLVEKLFETVDPNVYRILLRTFSRLDFVEQWVEDLTNTNAADLFCQRYMFNQIFDNFRDLKEESVKVDDLLCSDTGKKFISDVYGIFDLDKFERIVNSALSMLINAAFKQVVRIEKANLTSLVRNAKDFVAYCNSPKLERPDFGVFRYSERWSAVFNETAAQGRLDLFGIHLSIAKLVGSNSLTFMTIKPDMENMDTIADVILLDLRANPTTWIGDVRLHQPELIESFYLTASDREKALKILEYANFTRSYCTDPKPPALLNFPKGSNETLLKELVCRLSKSVQGNLELNVTSLEQEEAMYRTKRSFNWTAFNEKTIAIYEYVDTLVHQEDRSYSSEKLARLKEDFKAAWFDNITAEDSWSISVGLLCKLFTIMESPIFEIQAKRDWKNVHGVAWASSVIFDNIERIVDQIQLHDRVAKLPDILQDLPQTQILTDTVLRNLSPLMVDLVDVITMNPIHLLSVVEDYQSRETHWPCVQNESIGENLQLRPGSREIVREVERIACNPELFVREWKDQPIITRVRKIFQHDDSVELPSFNWTLGYTKFRRLVRKFDILVNDAKEVLLADEPKLAERMSILFPELENTFEERLPAIKNDSRNALDYIDLQLDKVVDAFKSNKSASEIWKSDVSIEERLMILLKFSSQVVHKASRIIIDILQHATPKISLLSLLGFDSKSPVTIIHNQLPYILATFADGLSDPTLDDKIVQTLERRRAVSCPEVFEWFSDFVVGLTPEEYRTLKNFSCDGDPEGFNVFTELAMAESTIWRTPARKYRSFVVGMVGDVYEIGKLIARRPEEGLVIERPFSKKYLDDVLVRLRDILKAKDREPEPRKDLSADFVWTNYRLLVEGISEALVHISESLRNVEPKDNRIHTWELVKNGDVRQLIKILEAHPEETIALIASLAKFNMTTGSLVPYKDLRKTMCNFHFYSDYWSQPNRTRFLSDVCSFDAYQLLKTITSQEYYDILLRRSYTLSNPTTLSSSLSTLLDSVLNLTSRVPDVSLSSNIFNATTWSDLSNETWSLIRLSEQSWIHEIVSLVSSARRSPRNANEATHLDLYTQSVRLYHLIDVAMELLLGGDVWQKLRTIYESSRVKPLLNLIEDTPNLAVTVAETFLTSERVNDYIEKLLLGSLHPCDIDRYLIPPNYMRKKSLLSSITNFCQKLVHSERPLDILDVLPLDARFEESRVGNDPSAPVNETYLLEKTEHLQATLVRVFSEGSKDPKVPTWWTSFEGGTYKDFSAKYKKKDLRALAHSAVKKLFSSVSTTMNSAVDPKKCLWCTTLPVEILNSQLSRHELYSKLICQLSRSNISELHDIMMRDFYWNKTASMVKDYRYLRGNKTVNDFVSTLEITAHYLTDIVVDFQNKTYHKRVSDCLHRFLGTPAYTSPRLYVMFLLGLLDTFQKNVNVLDNAKGHQKLENLTKLAERNVPIWKPLRDVVKEEERKAIEEFLPGALINVNMILNDRPNALCRTNSACEDEAVLYEVLSSKKIGKVFRYDPKETKYPSLMEVSNRLAKALDLELISRQQFNWRLDAGWDLTWLKEMLRHLSIVFGEGGNLLDVASKIDFQDVSNILGVPDLADGVVNLLKDKTVDKLFSGMKELLEDVEPFLMDEELTNDLRSMITALESMEIFKNLGLLDMKYVVSEMFDNWDVVRSYVVDEIGISNDITLALSRAKIDMISVFMKERHAISLKDTICDPKKLSDMLNVEQARATVEEISAALCQLNDTQAQNVTITLMKNLNFDYIFKNLMSANVKNILSNANLTESEGKIVLDNLGVASELLPFFKDKLSNSFSSSKLAEGEAEESEEGMSNSQFLQDSSEMLCGRALISDNGQIYKIISSLEDSNKGLEERELETLPSEFCKETYKGVIAMNAGKIIWSYVKPLLRGHILYAPNTRVISEVMGIANETFLQMEHFSTLMDSFEKSLTSLANLSEMGDSLRELQDIMSSDVMRIAIKSMAGGNFEGDFSELNLSEVAWQLKRSKKLITMIGMLNDLIGCVLVDRMKGFPTEEEMEAEARLLMETNEFLAGVVFLHDNSGRYARSLEDELPNNITYKIRMDVDYVPSTRRLKTQFWIPGPESSFIEDLRYLRGFVQLQDSVDRAIVKVKSGMDRDWKTMTEQMPYPCWKHIPFQSTLYESQGMQVCFFFALMMCVGSAVRHIVWERESRNSMVMSVMGLKPWRNTLAWFITSYVELMIVMISISVILLAGKILPRADPLLILILFLDYSFSVVTFCYMISTMFSSASLAAVTTVVMFLLTYMPYVIVIAMEAVIGLGYKLFICFSMSTSFCYGCLYAVRKEVQGVGLNWGNVWEESSPGDPMSIGFVLMMMFLDGCLYATIGYLIVRYSNSEDESDVSSLTVSEKQIGVRFEGVRKVYHAEQGDVVAVDDFSLKLCEGEVTSLLGRNGAGKTTIIKMLTGMLAPTSGEICLNGEEGCKPDIGVCPQDNVLIGTLTPREHMVFYSKLKRSAGGIDMERNVNDMMASLELGRQEHEPVCRLSGGTRRRVCVALAFLGSPKLVILDEPGAGVDPAARRRIWRLIDQHRIGRTVLLSTHHLDEADMLSDTVVVMHRGKILCTGSPLSLKMTHGHGYRLNVSFPPKGPDAVDSIERKKLEALRTVMEEAVPNATFNEISGSEIVVTLPFQGKNGMDNDIAQAAKALEDNSKHLGYSHFSLECDTLERVFLDLCAKEESGSTIRASQDSVASVDYVGLQIPNDGIDLINVETTPRPSAIRQTKALIKKRLWHFAKDWRAPLATLILPTMFVAVAMGFSLIRPPSEDEPPLPLTPKLYDTHPTYFYSIADGNDPFLQHVSLQLHDRFGDDYAGAWQTLPNDTGTCECTDGQQACHGVSQAVEGLLQILPGRPTLDWIVSTHQEYIEKRYGGWSLSHEGDKPLFVVWYNNKGHHSMPAYLNALNEAILRASGVQGNLTTLNHPLKLSSDQLNRTTLLQHVADVGVALVLLVAFSLVGAQGAKELVRERLSEEKRILYLAGVHPVTYWTTVLIWDFIVFGCSILLAVIVFEIFGLPAYVARDNLAGVCLLLFLFGWAAIPFSHLVEKSFDDPSLSNMVLFCVNTFIGVASLATILVIDILGKTQAADNARRILHSTLLVLPQYALGDALVQLSRNDITAGLLEKFHMNTYKSPLGWDLLGLHYVILFVVGSVLFLTNLAIECRVLPSFRRRNIAYEAGQEDEDVARERMRVEAGICDDTLRTVKLRKEYRSVYGTNVAVQNLSFGVQAGTCFGLLGVNGAGKSTTFRMLTTEIIPTAGKILLKREDIGTGPLCNGEVGYCPQTDALDGFLSPHQCLTIHGEVCGLDNVPQHVESMLKRFDLLKYAHRKVDSLSGGNKRKLCAAISVMAPVSAVLMDEPTSGMDPATKDLVGKAVRNVTKNQGCVILTSHSVAECENLCTRVGILARAGLRCIGTPQHLKHKFGEGYVAFLRFGQPVSAADLRRIMAKHLPQAIISSRQANAARILVPRNQHVALSTSFTKVKLLAEELKATDYTLTQSSLDQVLVNFSEELEDDTIDASACGQGSRNSLPNMYSSMDTIHMDTF
ncbi:hypothetical protein KM043_005838 [Ampulex compressa]|nr:hypothetical protein KM043_005838 [Ampulex compressa]